MEKVFEDAFMEIQIQMIELCLELSAGKSVNAIFVYGSIEDETLSFNACYLYEQSIISASKISESSMTRDFLRLGSQDLSEVVAVCKQYGKPIPTEIRLAYDVNKGTLDARYQYNPICGVGTGITPMQVFEQWKKDIMLRYNEEDSE